VRERRSCTNIALREVSVVHILVIAFFFGVIPLFSLNFEIRERDSCLFDLVWF
jgi:hypothetical protein